MLHHWKETTPPTVGTAVAQEAPFVETGSSARSAVLYSHLTPLETISALWTGTVDGFGKALGRDSCQGPVCEWRGPIRLGQEKEGPVK